MVPKAMIVRGVATVLALSAMRYLAVPLPWTFVAVLALDLMDYYLQAWVPALFEADRWNYTHHYQRWDKTVDWLTYVLWICLYWAYFPAGMQMFLVVMMLWRLAGVVLFFQDNNTRYLHWCPDMISWSILVFGVAGASPLLPWLLIATLALKLSFERVMHHRASYTPDVPKGDVKFHGKDVGVVGTVGKRD